MINVWNFFDFVEDYGMVIVVFIVSCLVLFLPLYCGIGSKGNVAHIESNAKQYFGDNGLEIIVKEGYQRTAKWGRYHGGGKVWYQVIRTNNKSVAYRLYLHRWGKDNIQMWNMRPIGKYSIVEGATPVNIVP